LDYYINKYNILQNLSRTFIYRAALIGHNLAIASPSSPSRKLLLVVLLTIMLLLPLHQVEGLIAERAAARASAVERVAHGVGHAQSIGSVMMIVPVTRSWVDNGRKYSETKTHRLLSGSVDVTGSVDSTLRRSGIYTVPTFKATVHIAGWISDELLVEACAPSAGS
jgi:inner membrane protein involved in colicin E2 resistance